MALSRAQWRNRAFGSSRAYSRDASRTTKEKKREREGEVVSNNERSIEGKTFIAEERRLKREKSGSVSRRKLLCRSKIIIRGTL